MNKGRKTTFEERLNVVQYDLIARKIISWQPMNIRYLTNKYMDGFVNTNWMVQMGWLTVEVKKQNQVITCLILNVWKKLERQNNGIAAGFKWKMIT